MSVKMMVGMKVCVGLFTFFVGYGFFYAKNVSFKYIADHIWRLLKAYWIVLIPTAIIAYTGDCVDIQPFICNIFGLKHEYNLGNWYVYFYIYAMCILPLISLIYRKWNTYYLLALILLFAVAGALMPQGDFISRAIHECLFYTPMLITGYLCAGTNIIKKVATKFKSKYLIAMIGLAALATRCAFGSIKGFSTDPILVPLIVMAITAIFIGYENSWIAKTLYSLGKYSTLMWFIHALPFSDATRRIFQESHFWTNDIFILFVGVTIISYGLSRLFTELLKG